jgi:ABC-type branched-subunit amino acid transport system substrate-binding protein
MAEQLSGGRRCSRQLLLATALLAATVGCGSTLEPGTVAVPGSAADGLTGGNATGTLPGSAVGGAQPGSGATGSVPAGTTGTTSGAVIPAATSTGSSGTVGSVATPKAPVSVGFIVIKGYEAVGAALALQGEPPSGAQVKWQALVDDANARGGLLGHPIRPVYITHDASSSDSLPAQEEAQCAKLTQDNHVIAAFINVLHTSTLLGCLQRAGVITFVVPGHSEDDEGIYDRYPRLRGVAHLNLTRLASTLVDGLWRQGFFTRGARIGLVTWDDPAFARAVKVFKGALASHGLQLTAEAATAPSRDLSDSGQSGADNSNAVLKFNTERVDHVIFLGGGGAPAVFFFKAAESQGYYPQYGLSTNDNPTSQLAQVAPGTAQNFWGVGTFPYQDIREQPTGASARHCEALFKRVGQSTGGDPGGWDYCTSVDLLVAAAKAGGSPLTAASILAGLDRRGGFTEILQFLRLDYARHGDGIVQARSFRYNATCNCLRYTSAPYPAAS